MRSIAVLTALSFLLVAAASVSPARAEKAGKTDFIGWALEKGKRLDADWAAATGASAGSAHGGLRHTGPVSLSRGRSTSRSYPHMRMTRDKTTNWRATREKATHSRSVREKTTHRRSVRSKTFSSRSTQLEPVNTSFTRRGTPPLLQMTSRRRSGPTRGVSRLTSPSQTTLAAPHNRRRPYNSSRQVRRSFRFRSEPTRPYLRSTGRWSARGRRSRSFTRPAYRADRPRRYRR